MPQGVTEDRPPELFPSPPPWGWSIGFIATPLTVGRLFNHLFLPALSIVLKNESSFEMVPIVAWHDSEMNLCAPELKTIRQYVGVVSINCALVPADLVNWAFLFFFISISI